MAIVAVALPPRCDIERAGCCDWNAETLPDKSVSEDERR